MADIVVAPNQAAVWIALIGSLTTVLSLVLTQFFMMRAQARRSEVQSEKLDELAVVGAETHVLVNSQRDELLAEIRELKRLLAAERAKDAP